MDPGKSKTTDKTPTLKPNYFLVKGKNNSALYDASTKQVIRINQSAAQIIELCNGLKTAEIVAAMAQAFKIDKGIAERDVLEFLNKSGKDFIAWSNRSPTKAKNEHLFSQGEPEAETSVTWEITNKCNLGCIHCLVKAGRKCRNELSDEQSRQVLLALSEAGIKEITFSGGEPTLRKNFFQLLKDANDYGMKTHVFTNGCIKKEVASKIAQEATGIQTTLLGAMEATHDELTNQDGSWRKTCSSLEIFSKANLEQLTISFVVMKENITEIQAAEKIAQGYKSKINFGLALPLGRAKLNHSRVLLEPTEIKLLPRSTEDQVIENQTLNHLSKINSFGVCPCSANSFAITSNGRISLCPGLRDFKLWKIDRQNIEKTFNDWRVKIGGFQRELSVDNIPVCLSCELRYSCKGGCRAVSYAYLGHIAKNPFCEIYK